MKKILMLFAAIFFGLQLSVFAASVYLKDGTVLTGNIKNQNSDRLMISTDYGLVKVPTYKIINIDYSGGGATGAASRPAATSTAAGQKIQTPGSTIIINQNQQQQQSTAGSSGNSSDKDVQSSKTQLDYMLKNKYFLNEDRRLKMVELSSKIPDTDRKLMYMMNKKSGWGWNSFGNFLIVGIGSWFQGDYGHAFLAELTAVIAVSLMGKDKTAGLGGTLYFLNGLYDLYRPSAFQKKYNGKLAQSLNLQMVFNYQKQNTSQYYVSLFNYNF